MVFRLSKFVDQPMQLCEDGVAYMWQISPRVWEALSVHRTKWTNEVVPLRFSISNLGSVVQGMNNAAHMQRLTRLESYKGFV